MRGAVSVWRGSAAEERPAHLSAALQEQEPVEGLEEDRVGLVDCARETGEKGQQREAQVLPGEEAHALVHRMLWPAAASFLRNRMMLKADWPSLGDARREADTRQHEARERAGRSARGEGSQSRGGLVEEQEQLGLGGELDTDRETLARLDRQTEAGEANHRVGVVLELAAKAEGGGEGSVDALQVRGGERRGWTDRSWRISSQ